MSREKAYLNFKSDDKEKLKKLFSDLLEEIKQRLNISSFWTTITIATEIALIVDHSIKTKEHPEKVIHRLNFINERLDLLEKYEKEDYFLNIEKNDYHKNNFWDIAREGFNFMWPKTTFKNDDFQDSCKMATERLNQIFDIADINPLNLNYLLDVGCGPARYLYASKKFNSNINLTGVDTGESILSINRKRKELTGINFIHDDVLCKTIDNKYSMLICNGVAHHTGVPLKKIIHRHSELIDKNGYYFIFVYGYAGYELKTWKFLQETVGKYNKTEVYSFWSSMINPLRVQGLMDHTYGVFYETKREEIELELENNFSSIKRIPGIYGLDVTEEIYSNDEYFDVKCGTGNLRYVAFK
tara:strand:- start:89 stop:1156 length:1068 start_codon:yes stop_codon:yes gene_type:complete